MNHEEKTTINYMEQLRKNWVIIMFLVGAVIGYRDIQNDIQSLKEKDQEQVTAITALDLRIDTFQKEISSISGDIQEIKVSLSFIKDRVGK